MSVRLPEMGSCPDQLALARQLAVFVELHTRFREAPAATEIEPVCPLMESVTVGMYETLFCVLADGLAVGAGVVVGGAI